MKLYLNGQIVEEKDAVISPFDHGFLYGMGVFETFRTYDGHPFLLGDHLERLNTSLKDMNIDYEMRFEQTCEIIRRLLEANGGEDGYFRLNISAGERGIGLDPSPYAEPTVMLLQKPVPPVLASKTGQWLKLRRNTPETATRLKSHHYLNNLAARREISSPSIEGLFLTEGGFAAEGITSNLFWVKKDTLFTPAVETGILPGVTRKLVMRLALLKGLRVEEGFFKAEEVEQADEVFVTNSIQELIPLTKLGAATFNGQHISRSLKSLYEQAVKDRLNAVNEVKIS
ncbi:aminodeoxychorismate lyase [Jeotgalibacillus sp. R-1-5s-1]|uniref:aminodeoxychorismate lyase n=1 Tax=Jeotgalibacillus sp. R-1-5s-1 TaxID=2555897 RepID=UPI00106B07D3|nr:aminodeoxychorismate lyase [Jeotgalibacillus sp. R-1-5s-1]TFE01942.1 aminodeoxychorismate lyase [Jeotgalibacillus sp. R-1-5s-1]